MGTRFYGYQVKREKWWEVATAIRDFYSKYIIGIIDKAGEKELRVKLEIARVAIESLQCELQVFENGEAYIFRPLERGYFLMNNRKHFDMEPVWYDDHTDPLPSDVRVKPIIDHVDTLIEAGHYFLYPVLKSDEYGMLPSNIFNHIVRSSKQEILGDAKETKA